MACASNFAAPSAAFGEHDAPWHYALCRGRGRVGAAHLILGRVGEAAPPPLAEELLPFSRAHNYSKLVLGCAEHRPRCRSVSRGGGGAGLLQLHAS